MFENSSDKQLLTIRNQLQRLLTDEAPDSNEEWRDLFMSSELGDNRKDVENNVVELAEEWMEKGKHPEELTNRYGKVARTTLKWLRENIEGWPEYERGFQLHQFVESVAYALQGNSSSENEEARIADLLTEANEDPGDVYMRFEAGKLIRKYINHLRRHLKEQQRLAETFFPGVLDKKAPFPKGWMGKTKELRDALATKKGQRLIKLLNILWNKKANWPTSKDIVLSLFERRIPRPQVLRHVDPTNGKLSTRATAHEVKKLREVWDKQYSRWIVVDPEKLNLNELANQLEISPETLRADFNRGVLAGALIQLPKSGPNTSFTYAIGTARSYTDSNGEKKPRYIAFLTEEKSKRLVYALSKSQT